PYLPSELPAGKHELVTLAGRAAFQSAANQRQQAAKGYQEMVSRHPDTPNAHYAFGVFLLADRPDEAVAELRRELEISPAHIAARLQLAGEFLHRSDYKAALTLAREAVELAPEAPIPHQMLGRSLMETGEL